MTDDTLIFNPVLKQLIWGGRRLGELLGKPIGSGSDYAESWEIVDHGDDQSVVSAGPHAGKTLHELVVHDQPWLLGPDHSFSSFPLLLKYLDCERVLSVQVHPDDAYGRRMPKPDQGKTEAWYIVDAAPGSLIYAGLLEGVGPAELERAIAQDNVEAVLHSFHPEAGDCVFIPAGTVHALGAGLVVAEIQQSSDTTFRIHDWKRTDAAGVRRPLHIHQAMEVIDFASGPVAPIRRQSATAGWRTLVDCDKFSLSILEAGSAELSPSGGCRILTVPRGTAQLTTPGGRTTLERGASILLPAATKQAMCEVAPGGCVLEMHPAISPPPDAVNP